MSSQGFLFAFLKFIEKPTDDTSLTRRHRQFTNVTPPCSVNSPKTFLLYPLPFQFLPLSLLLRPDPLQLLLDGSGLNQACNQLAKLFLQLLSLAVPPALSDGFRNPGRDFEAKLSRRFKVGPGGDSRIPRSTAFLITQLGNDLLGGLE